MKIRELRSAQVTPEGDKYYAVKTKRKFLELDPGEVVDAGNILPVEDQNPAPEQTAHATLAAAQADCMDWLARTPE